MYKMRMLSTDFMAVAMLEEGIINSEAFSVAVDIATVAVTDDRNAILVQVVGVFHLSSHSGQRRLL